MALSDASQITRKESDCDAMTNIVDKTDCLKLLRDQYQEILDTNSDALNAGAGSSGTYGILQKFEAERSACGPDYNCTIKAITNINNTQNEIAVRENRRSDAIAQIEHLNTKIKTLESSPNYVEGTKTKKTQRTIIIILAALIIIAIGLWLWKKYKK